MTPDAANGYIHEYEEWENENKALVDVRDRLMRRVVQLKAACVSARKALVAKYNPEECRILDEAIGDPNDVL